jgi:1,4-dihydroxy-2-naphthoate octaprenyltransferase
VAPVAAGTGAAIGLGAIEPVRAVLALIVALALQVGVNYANDYSDGVRGTDAVRIGPPRLVGSGAASPRAVRRAALAAFAVAGVAGTGLVLLAGQWWLVLVGAFAVAAAWTYTGGPRPYGYAGLGEVAVFVFFGLVAVLGTTYTQAGRVDAATVSAGVGVGALACALLVVNNLRDIASDRPAGKMTLAVRLGDRRTRRLYPGLVVIAGLAALAAAGLGSWWAVIALAALVPAVPVVRSVLAGSAGRDLVAALAATGRVHLLYGLALGVGLALPS